MSEHDPVTNPEHYTYGKVQLRELIEGCGWAEHHYRACAMKYIFRAGKKDPATKVLDLRKAIAYLERLIALEEHVP